jgi:hypothetical protein
VSGPRATGVTNMRLLCVPKLIIRQVAIHEDAFTGEQFCDWLKGTFDDVETLDQAAEWGRSLFEKGLIGALAINSTTDYKSAGN